MNHYVLIPRYLVGMRWWKQWMEFVGYDTCDKFDAGGPGGELNNPGPIDNSSLLARKTLHHLHDLYYSISHRP